MRRLSIAALVISLGVLNAVALAAQQGPSEAPQLSQDTSQLRGFVVTLALGEIQSANPQGTFTAAAAKALADLKDFLPYKVYRPLDTAWILGPNSQKISLSGMNGQKHAFQIVRSRNVSPTIIQVDELVLWDVAPPSPVAEKRGAPLLIQTAFKITVGETVVVGTSHLEGARALILLVTAAAR